VSDLDRMILNGVRPQAPAMAIAAPLNDVQLVILVAAIVAGPSLNLAAPTTDDLVQVSATQNARVREAALIEAEQLLHRAIQRARGDRQ
jgi:hypothetical protein